MEIGTVQYSKEQRVKGIEHCQQSRTHHTKLPFTATTHTTQYNTQNSTQHTEHHTTHPLLPVCGELKGLLGRCHLLKKRY
jgi:hypothetical protein